MFSAFPVFFESVFADPFPEFEPGFPYGEGIEPVVFSPQISQKPISSNAGSNPSPVNRSSVEPELISSITSSDTSNPNPCSGMEDPILNNPKKRNSGSVESKSDFLVERKRRRMISNRDSARRSRMRKQRHLENLRNLLSRLKVSNREVLDRVRVLMYQNHLVRRDNECLRSEAVVLRQRLWDIRQVLVVKQLMMINHPCAWPRSNNVNYYQNNNYYSSNNNFMPASNINNDGQLKHHSVAT